MRVLFIGRDNAFNRKYVQELFADHELVSCLFVEIDRFTLSGRLRKIRKRMKRKGVFRVLDELAFQVYSTFFLRSGKEKELKAAQPDYYYKSSALPCPSFDVANVHSYAWIEYIKEQQPNIIFSICCNVIFREKLLSIPKLGTYILHEGVTPEYKGLHTPIWALMRNDPAGLGYSVLKADAQIDGGDVLVQGRYLLGEEEGLHTWSWIGHNALVEGMPAIREAFKHLEADQQFEPVPIEGRESQYYSWVTPSAYLRSKLSKKPKVAEQS